MLIYALCLDTMSTRNHNHWGMSKSIPYWKKNSKGDTWQLMTGLPCKTAPKRSLRLICVSSSGSARSPLSLRQLLSTASLGKPVPDSCLFTYSTTYGGTQFCNSKNCIDSSSAAGVPICATRASGLVRLVCILPVNYALRVCSYYHIGQRTSYFTQETIAQHADV